MSQADSPARLIALYLPQFHPIPENDVWWGRGFTEWTNAAKATPMFRGHYQPNVPADLGFYDLRVPETRASQAELAREHGIEAFCYYHFWFAGKRLIERPFQEVLSSGQPDFPFCLCWANQTWTGIWHGAPNRILIEQTYPGLDDHRAHFETLLPAFRDHRYVTVDGKPLFVVYMPEEIPDSVDVTGLWRDLAVKAGLPGLYLVAYHWDANWDPRIWGYDASVVARLAPRRMISVSSSRLTSRISKKYRKLMRLPRVYRYEEVVDDLIVDPVPGIESFPCVVPNWDNTPRSGVNGLVLSGSTPRAFQSHLRRAIARVHHAPAEHRLIFIKSWNEWAEGNYLEPDMQFGRAYLEAVREEMERR